MKRGQQDFPLDKASCDNLNAESIGNSNQDLNGNSFGNDMYVQNERNHANTHDSQSNYHMKTSNTFMYDCQESSVDDKATFGQHYSRVHNNSIYETKINNYDSSMQVLSSPESISSPQEKLDSNRIQLSRKTNQNSRFSQYFKTNEAKAKVRMRRVTFEAEPPELRFDSRSSTCTNTADNTEANLTDRHSQDPLNKGINSFLYQSKVNPRNAADLSSDMMNSINDANSIDDPKSQVKIVPTIRGEKIVASPICTVVESTLNVHTDVVAPLGDNSSSSHDKFTPFGEGMFSCSEYVSRDNDQLHGSSATFNIERESNSKPCLERLAENSSPNEAMPRHFRFYDSPSPAGQLDKNTIDLTMDNNDSSNESWCNQSSQLTSSMSFEVNQNSTTTPIENSCIGPAKTLRYRFGPKSDTFKKEKKNSIKAAFQHQKNLAKDQSLLFGTKRASNEHIQTDNSKRVRSHKSSSISRFLLRSKQDNLKGCDSRK